MYKGIKLNLKDIQLYVFSGRGLLNSQEQFFYEKCYEMWKSVWKKTFLELDGSDELYSDNFTRQDKICAFFYRDTCIAMAAYRHVDFNIQNTKEDSIFSAWDDESIKSMTSEGSHVFVCSNFAVHPDFRKEISPGISLKHLLVYISNREFIASDCHVMAGATRCNKGVNTAALSKGANYIKTSTMHKVNVDLVVVKRSSVENTFNDFTGNYIWNNRIDFTAEILRNKKKVA